MNAKYTVLQKLSLHKKMTSLHHFVYFTSLFLMFLVNTLDLISPGKQSSAKEEIQPFLYKQEKLVEEIQFLTCVTS